jgi:hypothetical protein
MLVYPSPLREGVKYRQFKRGRGRKKSLDYITTTS